MGCAAANSTGTDQRKAASRAASAPGCTGQQRADQQRAVRRTAARGRGASPIALDWSGDAQTSGRGRRGPWNATGPMPAPAPVHAPASSTRRAPRTSGTHPYGNAPESTAKKPPTGTSGAEEPGTSPTPPAPSGRTPVLATPGHRDSPTSRQYGAGQRPPGKRVPWPAMGTASPVGRVAVAAVGAPGPRCGRRAPPRRAVSQTWAESPPWARQAPPRRDVSQTTDLLDPSGRSQGMRMIMCREHPDESARRDSRTSASAVFSPVARIPCSTMRRHVLMHEDDGKSQCRPPPMGSSAMTSPEPSPLTS